MNFPDDYFDKMEPRMQRAFAAFTDLERGAVANPDENRRVFIVRDGFQCGTRAAAVQVKCHWLDCYTLICNVL